MVEGLRTPKPEETASPVQKKKRPRFPDRITIEPKALARLDQWITHLKSRHSGIEITKKDLLNWLIERHDEKLTPSEERQLSEKFYDEERFLKHAWKEIRQAKSRGESLTLEEILKRRRQIASSPIQARKPRTPKPQDGSKPSAPNLEVKL